MASRKKRKKYSEDEKKRNRQKYEESFTGNLMSYAALVGKSFESRINLLAQIIRDAHYLSLGTYKERLLIKTIKEFIPKRYDVGTGFIIFPTEKTDDNNQPIPYKTLSGVEHIVSRQCDIIVYDSFDYAPIFKDDDFVVVKPESVRSVIEVKGTLDQDSIKDFMDHFIDLGEKWNHCNKCFYKRYKEDIDLSEIKLLMLAWQKKVDNEGRWKIDGKILREEIARIYKEEVNQEDLKFFPYLSSALIYDDCIVRSCFGSNNDELGFITENGKFISYNEQEPREVGDKTIASLLYEIYISLESPFNQAFVFFEQEPEGINPLPYEHEGFTAWLEENARELIGFRERREWVLKRFGIKEKS